METYNSKNLPGDECSKNNRREFLKKGIILGTLTGTGGSGLFNACKEEVEEEVTPSEDLMREHGVLNRILLIYDTCRMHLVSKEQLDLSILGNSAQIIRDFIEDYHEKLEEDYLFPRFEEANELIELIKVLRMQHNAGRILTDQIMTFGNMKSLSDTEQIQKLIELLNNFNRMYRPLI